MNAPAEKIFPFIDGLKRWTEWSPYEGRDPAMKRTYGGAESGKGAVYAWDGNDTVGKGRMEIVDSTPPHRVVIKLDFLKPFEGHNMAELTVEPKGSQTIVTWAMYGPSTFMTKLIGTFMDMAPMIIICTPIFLPLVKAFGIDPVHFGVILILNAGIGLNTPPVGSVLFVGCAVGKITIGEAMKTIWPFFGASVAVLLLVTYIPELSLWLPRLFH